MNGWLEGMLAAVMLLTPDERKAHADLIDAITADIEALGVEITGAQIDAIIDARCAEFANRRMTGGAS